MSSASSTDGAQTRHRRVAGSGDRVRGVALLGSTGSIGRQALEVLAADPSFRLVALAAGRNARLLIEQASRHRPSVVALTDPDAARELAAGIAAGIEIGGGDDVLVELATRDDVDLVVVGTGGVVSLRPVLAALEAGKIVATANKETLVAGGHLVMPLARARAAEREAVDPADPLASPLERIASRR